MQEFPDLVPTPSHHVEPLMRDGSQFTCAFLHPGIDGGVVLDRTVESQKIRSRRRSTAAGSQLRSQGATLFSIAANSSRVRGRLRHRFSASFVALSATASLP